MAFNYDPLHGNYNYPADQRKDRAEEQRLLVREQLPAMSNSELLAEFRALAGGDDYDGSLTEGGRAAFEELERELFSRLQGVGFLSKEANDAE